jgi:hypothetical protein
MIHVFTHCVGLLLHSIDDVLTASLVQPQHLHLLSANDRDVAAMLGGHRFPLVDGSLIFRFELRKSRQLIRLVPRSQLHIFVEDRLELLEQRRPDRRVWKIERAGDENRCSGLGSEGVNIG